MSDEERAWLPTHLQQAEKVLDKQSADDVPRDTGSGQRRRRKKDRTITLPRKRSNKPPRDFTSFDQATVDKFTPGKAYDFDRHNSLTNVVTRHKGMTFVKADGGVLWFRDPGNKRGKRSEQLRYFRASALFKVEESK